MRCSDRPTSTGCRPLASAALAALSTRATLEAKQATATRPFAVITTSISASRTSPSEPDLPGDIAFVLSQTMASTPFSPASISACSSVLGPTIGSGSSFQSPVCMISPAGVLMISAFGSGMEWVSVISFTENGARSTVPDIGISITGTRSPKSVSASLRRNTAAVNGVA